MRSLSIVHASSQSGTGPDRSAISIVSRRSFVHSPSQVSGGRASQRSRSASSE
jgi:hypothetical protein